MPTKPTEMQRRLTLPSSVRDAPADPAPLRRWLNTRANDADLTWLYAELDDGHTWGHFKKGSLTTAADVFPDDPDDPAAPVDAAAAFTPSNRWRVPPLRLAVVRRLWAFADHACLTLARRREGVWATTLFEKATDPLPEGARTWSEHTEEAYLLAGTLAEQAEPWRSQDGFTLAYEPTTATRHVVPLPLEPRQRAELVWRGYRPDLDPDDLDTHLGRPVCWRPFRLERI